MPSVIYRDPKIKINAVVYKDTTVRVKKLRVGTPIKRVTSGAFNVDNLSGVSTIGKTAGSILAYNAATTEWSTTNFASGNNISTTFDSAANTFTFGTNSDVTFNDVVVSGDLTVSGTQTTVNTETILLADNVIVVNSNATGSATENGGIEVERGDDANKTLIWNESIDKWTVGSETFVAERFEGDVDGALLVDVYNNTGSTLSKGDAVYLTGGSNGGNPHVALADADDASKMPALGIVTNDIGNNSVGQVTTSGVINVGTFGYTLGADLYISSTAGQLTTTKPTGEANLIQKIGKVISQNHIIVQGAFRTNQTPNLNDGKIFIGNGSNQSVTSTLDTSIVPENSNLYHTTARARNAVSAIGDLSYNSSTGVFSIDVEDAYTKVNFDSDLSAANTGQLPEGSNLYHTTARARSAISVTDAGGDGSLAYNSSTGVITYTGASAAEVRAHFSASGDLSYNSSTGQFSFDVESVYTKANFDSDLGLANTGQLPEGSNLYYTDARVDARITTAAVTATGALMDSELASIADVKALDQSVVSGSSPTFGTANFTDASDKRLMTDAQETKLDSVETNADVTDTANVTSAGALMDSELTDLAGVKGVTISTLQPKPSEGAFVNGDKTKLDGIETGATADQTDAEIKTAYENNSDTNAFTDAEKTKLTNIEASADVTDTANVTSAGALMDSELTDLAGVKGVTISTLQPKPSEGAFANGDKTKLDGIEASADVTDTANVTSAGALMDSELTDLAGVKGVTISTLQVKPSEGAFADGDKTKLDAIEASADVTDTANVTAAGALMDSELTDLAGVKGVTISTLQVKPSEGAFANGDKTKLDGIEASADVTDTANVTSAGALMDSELASIADVKALDQSVVSGASPNFTTTNMSDATNKRFMTDAQESKLDGIEASATADQSASEIRAFFTANKGLSVSSGEFNIDSANVKAMFSGGTGVTYNDGAISIGQAVATTSDVTFNDLTISGDLNVLGTQTTVNTENLTVKDSLLQLADSNESSDNLDIGFIGHYFRTGQRRHTGLFRDASNEQYYLFNNMKDSAFDSSSPPNVINRGATDFTLSTLNVGSLVGNVTGTVSSLSNHDTDDLSEGSTNLYYTDARADARITTAKVTAVGALMDSELASIADVKALDQSVVSGASPTFGTANFTDASNKRFMSDAQESKLDGIEASADVTDTANVTAAGALMDSELTDLAGVKGVTISTLQVKPSEGAFANGDKTKLDGIEASADVTDTANVTAAGALMDSELTDLAGVKGVTISTLQVKPSEGAFADGDKTKLDAIEASADVTDTANVTAAGALMDSELTDLAGVKGVTISNLQPKPSEGAFANGDKTKLDGIEASADVTDATNVTAAGALMDSELTSIADVKALDQSVVSGASPNFATTNMTDASNKRFMTDAQETKLDSVESSADVTDATNVTAAGALMDSELASIADVKALDQSVVSGASPTFGTANMTDASNKRFMTDAQETKLDSVESSATADQTAAEILTAVKTVDGASSGLDADLLDGVQGASYLRSDANDTFTGDLTVAGTLQVEGATGETIRLHRDDTTVTGGNLIGQIAFSHDDDTNSGDGVLIKGIANGATGNSTLQIHTGTPGSLTEKVRITDSGVDITGTVEFDGLSGTGAVTVTDILDEDDMSTNSATMLATQQSIKAYVDANAGSMSDAQVRAAVEAATDSNVFTDADHTKLNGIEASATADQTAAEILTAIKTVDGSGSGLDADVLDGIGSGSFLRSDTADAVNAYTTQITFPSNTSGGTASGNQASLQVYQGTANADAFITFHVDADFAAYFGIDGTTNDLFVGGWSMGANKYKIWHQNNDGSGSGLDADTLDGVQGASYLRSDADDTFTGTLTVAGSLDVNGSADFVGNIEIQATTGYAYMEMGGPSGAFIDLKSPFSDDYDFRIITGGTSTTLNGQSGDLILQRAGSTKLNVTTTGINVTGATTTTGTSGTLQWSAGTAGQKLAIYGYDNSTFYHRLDSGNATNYQWGAYDNIPIYTITNNTVRTTLTADGLFGIGVTSPAEKLDVVGNIKVSGHINIADTNTKISEGSGNVVRITSNSGYVDVGPQNTSYSHFSTDRAKFYFNKQINVNTGIITSHDEDLKLQRAGSSTNQLLYADGLATFGTQVSMPTLRLTSGGDASLSSTAHVLQLGPTSGTNMAIDGNEILARNNGAASTLILQNDGGNLSACAGGGTTTLGGQLAMGGNDIDNAANIYLGNVLYHHGDTNTYLQFHAADSFQIVAGGSQKMITTTTNTTFTTDITVADQIMHEGDTNTYMQFHAADQWRVVTGGNERLEVNNTATTVNQELRGLGHINLKSDSTTATRYVHMPRGGGVTFYGDGNVNHSITSRNISGTAADDILIAAYGSVLVKLDSNNNQTAGANFRIYANGSSTLLFDVDGEDGDVVAAGDVTAFSDVRLKENIKVIPNALEKVSKIRGVTFTRNDKNNKEKVYTGVIAQEVEKVLPEVVNTSDEDIKTVAYGNMVGLLIEAVKEQQEQINELKKQIEEMK